MYSGNKILYVDRNMFQWAKIVVSLERSVAQEDAHKYLQEYSIGLGPSDDPRYEVRAVMVIKSKSKTRAKQRKGALANWKVSIKWKSTNLACKKSHWLKLYSLTKFSVI